MAVHAVRHAVLGLLLIVTPVLAADPGPPAAGRLRGEVRTPDLKPVVGATAIAVRAETPPAIVLTASDTDGFLAVDGVPSGTWTLNVLAEGYSPGSIAGLTVGGPYRSVADMTLRRGAAPQMSLKIPGDPAPGALVIRTVDGQGQSLPGVRVQFKPVQHRSDPLLAETGPEGDTRLDNAKGGRWRIEITRAGWTRLVAPDVEWPGGELTIVARLLPLPENAQAPLEELLPPPRLVESSGEPPAPIAESR